MARSRRDRDTQRLREWSHALSRAVSIQCLAPLLLAAALLAYGTPMVRPLAIAGIAVLTLGLVADHASRAIERRCGNGR